LPISGGKRDQEKASEEEHEERFYWRRMSLCVEKAATKKRIKNIVT